jgi:hypothetical protein
MVWRFETRWYRHQPFLRHCVPAKIRPLIDYSNASEGRQPMSETTAGKVYLSYRQGGDTPVAEQLHYWLEEEFGSAAQFLDAQSPPAGREVKFGINERAAECDVLLVLISEAWLDAADGNGGCSIAPMTPCSSSLPRHCARESGSSRCL